MLIDLSPAEIRLISDALGTTVAAHERYAEDGPVETAGDVESMLVEAKEHGEQMRALTLLARRFKGYLDQGLPHDREQ